jgi:hypothetical protein
VKEGFGQRYDEVKENFEDEAGQIIKDEVEQDLHANSPSCRPSIGPLFELDVEDRRCGPPSWDRFVMSVSA